MQKALCKATLVAAPFLDVLCNKDWWKGMVIEMKKRFVYAAGPTILTIFFAVQCIMR